MKTNSFLSILLLLVLGGGAYFYFYQPMHKAAITESHCSLRKGLRKLWSDHVFWTRQYIVSALADLPDAKAASERLLKNQEDLGNAIVPFYGKEAGDQLAQLLKEHILIAVDVVAAAKAGDNEKLKVADKKWHDNADELAQFFSKANPNNWPEAEMRDMFYEHLKLTTQEAVLRLKKDWSADVANFDAIFDQAMHMADGLAQGIATQFADKLK